MLNKGISIFAGLTALATLCLIGVGGLVTSHGVGMAVTDWPNTNGYNMFFFPFSQWVGGILYEHSHRLVASGVGLLTTILALWLHGRRARGVTRWGGALLAVAGILLLVGVPRRWQDAIVLLVVGVASLASSFVWPRTEPAPKWLRRLGLLAFGAVVLQGVLGGLRVTAMKDEIGIFHAALAQLFFVLTCGIALFTTRWWESFALAAKSVPRSMLRTFGVTTVMIFVQLVLGATMRHAHAGLAIPDFPLAYGRVWPDTSPAAVERYNRQRLEVIAVNPITRGQIILQMAHRLLAVAIALHVGLCLGKAWKKLPRGNAVTRVCIAWAALIALQVGLGAATIWSDKAADIATLHVVVGALSLAAGAIVCLLSYRMLAPAVGETGRSGWEARKGLQLRPQSVESSS